MATTNTISVAIISREMIKPSSATPDHLKLFQFSSLDQMIPLYSYAPLLLFYNLNQKQTPTTISQLLKSSLSKNLSNFYPFAGRIKDHVFVECNDQGVEFIDARIGCHLADFLQQPDPEKLNILLPPINTESMEGSTPTGSFVYVQLNVFQCGGFAIGICISHKLADANTITTFIKGWSTCISTQSDKSILPNFSSSSLFPPVNKLDVPKLQLPLAKSVQRRFVFSAKKLAELKVKLASASLQPTSVEALTALIWKCSMTTKSSTPNGMFCCSHAVNLRKRFSPPLPENSVGNLLGYLSTKTKNSSSTLQDLVCQVRKEKESFSVYDKKNVLGKMSEDIGSLKIIEESKLFMFHFSSWCKLPFYEADFGWGKPLWVTVAMSGLQDAALFMDAKEEGGIEVLIWLSAQEMDLFMSNQDFLEFATPNPSVLVISRSKL